MFERVSVDVGGGKRFEVVCSNWAPDNIYIQSATLNGKVLGNSWISHDDIAGGGRLELVMGRYPNKAWASAAENYPPSSTSAMTMTEN